MPIWLAQNGTCGSVSLPSLAAPEAFCMTCWTCLGRPTDSGVDREPCHLPSF